MSTQDDIDQQQQLLATHRRTLVHLLDQQAQFSAGYVPAHVANGIAEARADIAQIKATLRSWGYPAPDAPGDVVSLSTSVAQRALLLAPSAPAPRRPSRLHRMGRSTGLIILAALLYVAGVITNLFSNAIEAPLQKWVGEGAYPSYFFGAMGMCLVLAVVAYLYDHRQADAAAESATSAPPDPAIDRHNRQILIKDMRLRIRERLETAPKLLLLPMAERSGAVDAPGALVRPYDIARRQSGQPDESLPARARIIDLYADHNQQLLILGAPGAGKSFLLHELARELLDRAEQDSTAPAPVIFSLASWSPEQTIEAWLIAELARRFGAKPVAMARLVQVGAIVPLLDGLDEVNTLERRQQCVAAINAYRAAQDRLPPLVVACREREYDDLPALKLNIALVVQPLARTQIQRYLAGPTFAGLRQTLDRDPQLADAVRTPLLLGLIATTYRNRAPDLPTDVDATALRVLILRDYVDRCLVPRVDAQVLRVSAVRLYVFLAWLARGMTAHNNQQEFYIEFMQPDWLPSHAWRRCWHALIINGFGLGGGLVSILFGRLFNGLLGGLFDEPFDELFGGLFDGLFGGLLNWLIMGLLIGLIFGLLMSLGLEPIRITRQRERRSGHRQNGERPDSAVVSSPSAPECAESGSSNCGCVQPPSGEHAALPRAPVPWLLRHATECEQ